MPWNKKAPPAWRASSSPAAHRRMNAVRRLRMAGRNGSPDRGAVSEADWEVDWLFPRTQMWCSAATDSSWRRRFGKPSARSGTPCQDRPLRYRIQAMNKKALSSCDSAFYTMFLMMESNFQVDGNVCLWYTKSEVLPKTVGGWSLAFPGGTLCAPPIPMERRGGQWL